jgi:drug/metabolite transporter (DMT)-like permease
LGYLTVFGSMLTYSAYMWLLKVSTPARVSTSAFVNPVIAVVLGWWLLDEAITSRILVAAGVIVGAVILIMAQSVSAVEPAEPV